MITWTDWNNGESLLLLRTNLNSFNNAAAIDVNANATAITAIQAKDTTQDGQITALDGRVTQNEADVVALEDFVFNPKDAVQFVPQVTPPTHIEGQLYYDAEDGTFVANGPLAGAPVALGHSMHVHVVNNTGAIIPKGAALRTSGISNGKVQVDLAIADSFVNSRVFGLAQDDIPAALGSEGSASTFGEINDLDTGAYPIGVPLYLSDTIPGAYSEVAPTIVTQVGGCLVSDVTIGKLFTAVVNNLSLPNIFGGMQGQTPTNETYNLTAVPQNVINYLSSETTVTSVDLLTGIITLPYDGQYRTNVSASLTFTSSTSTRTVYMEIYNVTDALVKYTYVKNIPRDATADSFSFTYPFAADATDEYVVRLWSDPNISIDLANISFDIESVSIR